MQLSFMYDYKKLLYSVKLQSRVTIYPCFWTLKKWWLDISNSLVCKAYNKVKRAFLWCATLCCATVTFWITNILISFYSQFVRRSWYLWMLGMEMTLYIILWEKPYANDYAIEFRSLACIFFINIYLHSASRSGNGIYEVKGIFGGGQALSWTGMRLSYQHYYINLLPYSKWCGFSKSGTPNSYPYCSLFAFEVFTRTCAHKHTHTDTLVHAHTYTQPSVLPFLYTHKPTKSSVESP